LRSAETANSEADQSNLVHAHMQRERERERERGSGRERETRARARKRPEETKDETPDHGNRFIFTVMKVISESDGDKQQ